MKKAVGNSIEPMKNLTSQAKEMASKNASRVSQMKTQMKDLSGSINSTAKQEEYLKFKIDDLKSTLGLLKGTKSFEGQEEEILKLSSRIEVLENKLNRLQNKKIEIEPELEEDSFNDKFNDFLHETKINFANVFKSIGKLSAKALVSGIQLAVKGVASASKQIISKIKSIIPGIKSFKKTSENTFSNGIKSIKKFAFSLLSVRSAFSVVSKAMQSYMSFDSQLSDSLQNCWNVLGSILAPVLEYLVKLFSQLVSYINAFVKALTGIDLVAKANAKALSSQANATDKLNDSQSSLDEFHTINNSESSDSDSSSSTITVDDVSIDGLLDKILNYDWYSIGIELGKKINEALSSIDWDFIKNLAVSLATKLGDLLNGLVDGIDWALIGSTIGNGINTVLSSIYTFMTTFNWGNLGISIADGINNAISTIDWTLLGKTLASKFVAIIDTAYGFVTTFDWAKFGTSIADAIMGFFNEIDWAKAGETLSDGIRGIFTSLKNLISGIDWAQLGKDIWDFIANIDWTGIIEDLAYVIGQAITGIAIFLGAFIEDAVNSIGDYFSGKIEECGGDIIGGLFKGIVDAIVGIADWIAVHVFQPFIDGFKSMFGINSPSTVMAEMGGYILEGLKNGLVGIWEKVKEIFENLKTNISEKFTEIVNKIKEIFSLQKMKEHFSEVLSGIKNVFSGVSDWFKDIFSSAWQKVKDVFSSGSQVFSGIKEGISDVFKSVVNTLIKGINTVIAIPFNAINKMLNTIRNTEIPIIGVQPFLKLWSENPLSVPQIPSLADGGVLTKETLVRVAEYSNASSNPEIVSPKDLMKQTFKEAFEETSANQQNTQKFEVEVTGETRIDGSDLVVVYDKAKQEKGYDGGKNPKFAY